MIKEQNHQRSLNKPHVKKIIYEDVSYTDDLLDFFPKYYDKSFLPVKKLLVSTLYSSNTPLMMGRLKMLTRKKNLNMKTSPSLLLLKN
jgi:hypothetical protein